MQKDQALQAILKKHPKALKLVGRPVVLLYTIQNMGTERHTLTSIPAKLVLRGPGGKQKTYLWRSLIKKSPNETPHKLAVVYHRDSRFVVTDSGVRGYSEEEDDPKSSLLVCYSAQMESETGSAS